MGMKKQNDMKETSLVQDIMIAMLESQLKIKQSVLNKYPGDERYTELENAYRYEWVEIERQLKELKGG